MLTIGTKVKIKNIPDDYKELAGEIKVIDKILSPLNGRKAFSIKDTKGIWIDTDFECQPKNNFN